VIARVFSITCRVIGALVVAGFVLVTFTSAPNTVARRIVIAPDIGPADAIVVLGASISADGSLGDSSMRRAVAGIRLYHQRLAPRLMMLGMYGEGRVRAGLARELGVPREALLVEEEEPTTRHEAWRAAQVLKRDGARTVLLVTDHLHMLRASRLFERAGLVVRAAPTDTGAVLARTPESRLLLTRAVLQEATALVYHRLFGYL